MNMKRLLGSVLLGLAFPAIAAQASESNAGGNIQLRSDSGGRSTTCNLPVGPAGSGQTRVYELRADGNPCASLNNKTDDIYFTDLPSAAQILLTDNSTCNTTGDKETVGKFWVKLKTTLKFTSPESMTMQYFFGQDKGSIIHPGLLLVDFYLDGDAVNAVNSLSCVKVITSRATLPKPVDPITYRDISWVDIGEEYDSKYHCEGNRIMSGRAHYGDEHEKGRTFYRCGTPYQGPIAIAAKNHKESINQFELQHYYVCPINTVMTGREHDGDEEGDTRYTCAEVWNGNTRLEVLPEDTWRGPFDTNHHTVDCGSNMVMIGRTQDGDELGENSYRCGRIMPAQP